MRLPTRKSEQWRIANTPADDPFLTPKAIERLRTELQDLLERQRPEMAAEVRRTGEMGDFSENAGYQAAKAQLRRINARIITLEERLKHVVAIERGSDDDGAVRIGSTVTLRLEDGREMTYELLGSHETNPGRGRISYQSPLGAALMGHRAGEEVRIPTTGAMITVMRVE